MQLREQNLGQCRHALGLNYHSLKPANGKRERETRDLLESEWEQGYGDYQEVKQVEGTPTEGLFMQNQPIGNNLQKRTIPTAT